MTKTAEQTLRRLVSDEAVSEDEMGHVEALLGLMMRQVGSSSRDAAERLGLDRDAVKLWYWAQVADGLRACLRLSITEIMATGSPAGRVGPVIRATLPGMWRSFSSQVDTVVPTLASAQESGDSVAVEIDGWTATAVPTPSGWREYGLTKIDDHMDEKEE